MNRKIIWSAMVLLVVFALDAWAGPQMNPGKWEITTTTEMAGMPPQTLTHIQCITNEDLVPMSGDADQECQVTDVTTQGNTVSWKITCGGQGGGMSGTGRVTYEGDRMHGSMEMIIAPYGTPVKNTLLGRRLGACDGTEGAVSGQNSGGSQSGQYGNVAQEPLAGDVRDAGQAAKDEAKQAFIDEIRKSTRGAITGIFK